MLKKYFLENPSEKNEKIIRKFLLSNSDKVRLTAIWWFEFVFFRIVRKGGEKDFEFTHVRDQLKKDFIIKVINNKKYESISQFKHSKFEHYFYRLSDSLKYKINSETLIWKVTPPISEFFYGFEDPVFYKKNKIIGSVISHESYIFLHLTDSDRKRLETRELKLKMCE